MANIDREVQELNEGEPDAKYKVLFSLAVMAKQPRILWKPNMESLSFKL
jgi:hypothetical protein